MRYISEIFAYGYNLVYVFSYGHVQSDPIKHLGYHLYIIRLKILNTHCPCADAAVAIDDALCQLVVSVSNGEMKTSCTCLPIENIVWVRLR